MKFKVIIHPNSKRIRVEKDLLGTINVHVKQPPLEGRANEAVVQALADYFKVKKYQVRILHGLKSKLKTCEINL